jgi:prephenate dehydrogenase
MINTSQNSIAVIGAGRFGSFWAKQISNYFIVKIYDKNIDETIKQDFAQQVDLEEALSQKFIFLTIPIREIEPFLIENSKKIAQNSILVDCASVKTKIVSLFEQNLPKEIQYVFTHPLFGPDSGSKGLKNLSISVQAGKIEYSNFQFLLNLYEKLHLNIISFTAEEHDFQMAFNLNLVHLLGRALSGMNISAISLKMNALTNLNQMSHYVINDSYQLFEDFFRFNPFAKQIVVEFQKNLQDVIDNHLKKIIEI